MPAPSLDRALLEPIATPTGISSEDWKERKKWLATALRGRMSGVSTTEEEWLECVPDDAIIRAYVLAAGQGAPHLSDEALRRFILDVRDAQEFSDVLYWMMIHVDRSERTDMCLYGTWRSSAPGATG
jgi:hypothetical protein